MDTRTHRRHWTGSRRNGHRFCVGWHPLQAQADAGDAEAQYLFAQRNGDDALQDFPSAARYFQMAAIQGHAGAQFALFSLYGGGLGVQRNPEQAIQWLLGWSAQR